MHLLSSDLFLNDSWMISTLSTTIQIIMDGPYDKRVIIPRAEMT